MRTKLPEVSTLNKDNPHFRDRDREQKQKSQDYTNIHRRASSDSVGEGDTVILKQSIRNKLTTPFAPKQYMIVQRHDNQVTVKDVDGVQSRRNNTHVKKFRNPSDGENDLNVSESSEQSVLDESSVHDDEEQVEIQPLRRSTRARASPAYYGDYVKH